MTVFVSAFVASFLFILIKSWQQLNIVYDKHLWIVPTSMLMAVCEVYVISQIAKQGWGWIVLAIGLGSGLGALSATILHRKIRDWDD